ncbi:MAG: glycosyltransferase [Rhizobiaceae bacterium]|nr:glycosyltransferase [Rhizobiaceae bacterium]
MTQPSSAKPEKLRILHCFRSPVGGIFRHVRDLIHQQKAQGHSVGVICDSNTGGDYEEQLLAELEPFVELGLFRIPMDRSIGPRDVLVMWKLYSKMRNVRADVLHAHGAKGGAYARLIGTLLRRGKSQNLVRLYCPHGGSVHYDRHRLSGRLYFGLERFLERLTDRLIFVSEYERDSYFAKIGETRCPYSLVRNGLNKDEFAPVIVNDEAADFLYIGMMRDLKGVDLLIEALPLVSKRLERPVTAKFIGGGPDLSTYKARAAELGDEADIEFLDPMPARLAFALGKTLVVPSRAESMPYIVLEALAASRPLLATRVGGIPEIFAKNSGALIEPDNLDALVRAMSGHVTGTVIGADFEELHEVVKTSFSAETMTETIMQAYRDTLNS